MQLISNAATMKWNWSGWFMGIMGATISGGANGLVAMAIGVSVQKTLILIGFSMAVSLGKFLQTHSTPDQLQEALAEAAVQSVKTTAAIAGAQAAADEKQP